MAVQELKIGSIQVKIFPTKEELGLAAAQHAAEVIAKLAPESVNILFATGTSQFPLVEGLKKQDIDWQRVHGFHLDEYKGISPDHPRVSASGCGSGSINSSTRRPSITSKGMRRILRRNASAMPHC